MEKKLTDEEIVKALECCATDKIAEVRCPECILEEENGCCTVLLLNALDLIHRLQEENKDLKEERENMQAVIFGLEEEKMRVRKQVDELMQANIDLWNANQCGVKFAKNPYKGVEVE